MELIFIYGPGKLTIGRAHLVEVERKIAALLPQCRQGTIT